jgi:LysR family nitrogen assimilation transcriptional regulator
MELRQLQYFVAMYEEGSVTRASRRLNIVQPAISQQLAKLEEELGTSLFNRTPRGITPTPAGDDAYRHFLPILHELERARQELSADNDSVKGHVSIGVVASVAHHALSDTLISFNAKYPEVTLRATGGFTAELLEMLRTGKTDLAIINAPARRTGFAHIDLLTEDFALICAAATLVELSGIGGDISLHDIDHERLVLPSPRHGLRVIMDEAAHAQGLRLTSRLEIDELNTIEDFILHTNFMTILPPIALHRALRTGLLRSHPILPRIPRRIVCAYNPARPLSRATELLITELRQRMVVALNYPSADSPTENP